MSQQVLDKAIEKAKKNGWEHPYNPDVETCFELLFDHDFLKALWGELTYYPLDGGECAVECDFCHNDLKVWEYHAQQLVISRDVFEYLRENS